MLIGIDLDEVLADTLSEYILFLNATYNMSLTYQDFHSPDWTKVYGGTKSESSSKFLHFTQTDYFQNVKPFQEAITAIDILVQKHDLVVITSRQIELKEATLAWIQKHYPNKFKDIFVTNHPLWAKTGKSMTKAEVCQKYGVDILIEDNLDYAMEAVSEKTSIMLLDYHWNQGKLPKGIYRVASWDDLVNHELVR